MVKVIVPVRCITCGKVIGHLWEKYQERKEKGEDGKKVLDSLGLVRYCCRQTFMGHIDLLKEISQFKP